RSPLRPPARRERARRHDPNRALHASRLDTLLRGLCVQRRGLPRLRTRRLAAAPQARRGPCARRRRLRLVLLHADRDGPLRPGDLLPAARRVRERRGAGPPRPPPALPAAAPARPLAAPGLSPGVGPPRGLRGLPLPRPRLLERAAGEHGVSRCRWHLLRRPPGCGLLPGCVRPRPP